MDEESSTTSELESQDINKNFSDNLAPVATICTAKKSDEIGEKPVQRTKRPLFTTRAELIHGEHPKVKRRKRRNVSVTNAKSQKGTASKVPCKLGEDVKPLSSLIPKSTLSAENVSVSKKSKRARGIKRASARISKIVHHSNNKAPIGYSTGGDNFHLLSKVMPKRKQRKNRASVRKQRNRVRRKRAMITKRKMLASKSRDQEDNVRHASWKSEKLPKLASVGIKSAKAYFSSEGKPKAQSQNNRLLKSSYSEGKTPIEEQLPIIRSTYIKAKSQKETFPNAKKYKPASSNDDLTSKIHPEDELPKLGRPNYQLCLPSFREISLPKLSSADDSFLDSLGLRSIDGPEEITNPIRPFGDLKIEVPSTDPIMLPHLKDPYSGEREVLETLPWVQKLDTPSRLSNATEHLLGEPSSTQAKPWRFGIKSCSKLTDTERKLRVIGALVRGWKVEGTKEDMQMLLDEIKKNL